MDYKSMIQNARRQGLTTESKMWQSIESLAPVLSMMEEEHPDEYNHFIRSQHELLYGKHYDEELAREDVKKMFSTDANGHTNYGEYWTVEEINAATAAKVFPPGTNQWDRYVAYNTTHHDLCKKFDDSQILEAAYLLFFADEDASEGKIWRYMSC